MKALSHAIYHIQLNSADPSIRDEVTVENMPIKVVEFVKKWIAKEKVLINQLVQSQELLEPDSNIEAESDEPTHDHSHLGKPQLTVGR